MIKRRNPIAKDPIMRKGGPHVRPRSGERAQRQRQLEEETDAAVMEREQSKKKHDKDTDTKPDNRSD